MCLCVCFLLYVLYSIVSCVVCFSLSSMWSQFLCPCTLYLYRAMYPSSAPFSVVRTFYVRLTWSLPVILCLYFYLLAFPHPLSPLALFGAFVQAVCFMFLSFQARDFSALTALLHFSLVGYGYLVIFLPFWAHGFSSHHSPPPFPTYGLWLACLFSCLSGRVAFFSPHRPPPFPVEWRKASQKKRSVIGTQRQRWLAMYCTLPMAICKDGQQKRLENGA